MLSDILYQLPYSIRKADETVKSKNCSVSFSSSRMEIKLWLNKAMAAENADEESAGKYLNLA